jgi:hypothetical protein
MTVWDFPGRNGGRAAHGNRKDLGSADEVPTKAADTMATQKTMLAVFLSVQSAIFINWLPLGARFNSRYFCQQMLEPLSQILHRERAAGSPRPIMHSDNAARHPSGRIGKMFSRLSVPSCSPTSL